MSEQNSRNRVEKWIFRILILGSILVNIKNIFTSFDVDAEYALVMPYRMLRGDEMISQMWEPHQTSAFLAAIFMKLYMAFFSNHHGNCSIYEFNWGLFKRSGNGCFVQNFEKLREQKSSFMRVYIFLYNESQNVGTAKHVLMRIAGLYSGLRMNFRRTK